jgi:sucrose phosphorylase
LGVFRTYQTNSTKNNLKLLPEIAEYGLHLHDEVANEGYTIYDFSLPGLTIHTIENKTSKALLLGKEIIAKGYKTVNMLGCHDGTIRFRFER